LDLDSIIKIQAWISTTKYDSPLISDVCLHSLIFYISNTLKKLMIKAKGFVLR